MALSLLKALADDTRLRIAHILAHYELSVNELARILGMGQSRVSRHLKILSEASLLRFRRDGLWVFYSGAQSGRGLDFLQAVLPFIGENVVYQQDMDLAAQILEERARRTRQFFNAIADDWDALNHEILGDFNLAEHVAQAMPPQCGAAVDLGCGTGEVLTRMLANTNLAIGVDGSARMLDLCRTRLGANRLSGQFSLRIGELSHLPLADNEADFACINLVLHHLPKPEEIFTEILRVLRPGGVLFLADFKQHNDETMRIRYGDHWLGFDDAEIEKLLQENNFKILSHIIQPVDKGLNLFIIKATINK